MELGVLLWLGGFGDSRWCPSFCYAILVNLATLWSLIWCPNFGGSLTMVHYTWRIMTWRFWLWRLGFGDDLVALMMTWRLCLVGDLVDGGFAFLLRWRWVESLLETSVSNIQRSNKSQSPMDIFKLNIIRFLILICFLLFSWFYKVILFYYYYEYFYYYFYSFLIVYIYIIKFNNVNKV